MKKFKALYKGMYDDLKDAEMMIDYACGIKDHSPEDKGVADEMAKYAKMRLDHFMTFHKIFVEEAMKHKEVDAKTVSHCMWEESHEQMQEWYDKIEKKISKYK
jgi:ATP-dependent protease ClpP protease subunit